MILRRLKTVLKEEGEASLGHLAHRLEAAPEVVQTMLDHWIRRGEAERRSLTCGKAGCTCPVKTEGTVYAWTGRRPTGAAASPTPPGSASGASS